MCPASSLSSIAGAGVPASAATSIVGSKSQSFSASAAATAVPSAISSYLSSLPTSVRTVAKALLIVTLVAVAAGCLLCTFHHGFRRTVQFWSSASPLLARYYFLKLKHRVFLRTPEEVWKNEIMPRYHRDTAPAVVAIIARMGGIYIKIGQFLATVGATLLEDTYVQALKPLMDGVPPRPLSEISAIIETSLGKPMGDIFESFDELPIGSASIAQAHRATLKEGIRVPSSAGSTGKNDIYMKEVVVKVQYPDVARNFHADLDNLEIVTKLIQPDRLAAMQMLRQRHVQELDFRAEAANLKECTGNMQRHGLEPQQVRIPRVADDLVSKEVLVMEFLRGVPLKDAMEQELDDVAAVLGMKSGSELRARMMQNLKQHFLNGGGDGVLVSNSDTVQGMQRIDTFNRGGSSAASKGQSPAIIMHMGKTAAPIIRRYALFVKNAKKTGVRLQNGLLRVGQIATLGQWQPEFTSPSDVIRSSSMNFDLSKVIKKLVMVHGVQVILDGVYNADPHPGNVLIMPDGRLGLIDYGMVGRLQLEQRRLIASTILALQRGDDDTVIRNYRDSGYVATWSDGSDHEDVVYKRCASFHFDTIDLKPVKLSNGEVWPVMELFSKTKGHAPEWIEHMKRIGGLMMGVSSQAGRPISLSKEWKPMAKRLLDDPTIIVVTPQKKHTYEAK